MLVTIQSEKCIACGLCQIYAPSVFDYDDDGIVLFKQASESTLQSIEKDMQKSVTAALKKCPTRAIFSTEH